MHDALITSLHPDLQAKARDHVKIAEARGITILFTSGTRSWAQQIAMYRQGREPSPDGWHVTDPHKVVTLALPDNDPHVRGAAYDLVPMVDGQMAWTRLDLFAELGAIGKTLGLGWGGDWPKLRDFCHFELRNWRDLPMPGEDADAVV